MVWGRFFSISMSPPTWLDRWVGFFLRHAHLWGLVYFTIAALAATWPLALHAGTDLPGLGDAGDRIFNTIDH